MKPYKHNEIILFMLLLMTMILLAGCVAAQSDVRYSGVENSQLRQIKPGITTKDQLIELVGEPTEYNTTDDGAEIFKYKCTTIKDNQFVLFPPPIIIDDTKETEHTIVFKIRDGIVQRHWKEQ